MKQNCHRKKEPVVYSYLLVFIYLEIRPSQNLVLKIKLSTWKQFKGKGDFMFISKTLKMHTSTYFKEEADGCEIILIV